MLISASFLSFTKQKSAGLHPILFSALLPFNFFKTFLSVRIYKGAIKWGYLCGRKHGQFSSVAQSCLTLCDSMDSSMPGFPIHYQLPEPAQTHVHWVGDAIQPPHPLSTPSIFPSIRVFSNESVLLIRWPQYWSFSFSISPSNELSGLISFRMDWLDLLAVQGLSRVFSNTTVQKHQFFGTHLSL